MRRWWMIIGVLMLSIVAGGTLWAQSGSGFYVEPGATMTVENNIIIYNSGQNINITASPYNAVVNANNILVDIENDFRLKSASSAANAGNNLYITWLRDIMDTFRIINTVVDLGAFEYPVTARAQQFAIHQVGESGLTFCNNIIVNNPEHYAVTNVAAVPSNNILSDSVPVLKDAVIDFSIGSASPAVNAGQNSCISLTKDMQDKDRVFNHTVDVGAFEYVVPQTFMDTFYTVWQNSLGTLTFCNNIDINNCVWSLNTNIATLSSNIVTDNDSLFVDNVDDYRPRPESEAVDAGQDACNQVEKDLADKQRVMGEQIDIGAFEQYVENEDTIGVTYAVHQISGHTLNLCNNVIVNNPEHHDVTNVALVPHSNILSDSIPVFSDAVLNFKPYYSSPAVDAGDNSCNGLVKDIDTVPRISGLAIDVGAFELPIREDSTYAGGGDGGGGYGYDVFHHSIVHKHIGDSLVLCNNIIINNSYFIPNAYPNADTTCNILTDQDSLFINNVANYRPRPESDAVDAGCNECNVEELDLSKKDRIYQDIIDIGAFEQYVDEVDTNLHDNVVVHQVNSGSLNLCNNVIVNNLAMDIPTNVDDVPDNNILSDSISIFCDAVNNFSLWSHSPAVDAGSNNCCALLKDMKEDMRILNDTIDIGAFEFLNPNTFIDTTFTVLQHENEVFTLCNNIIINNARFSLNTNIDSIPDNNIIEDNDSIFTHNQYDYMPLPQSIAVNQGENLCNLVGVDLARHARIMADTIDIGAFEQFVEIIDTFFAAAVFSGDTSHQLQLYNNIVINNPGHTENVYGNVTGDHNLTQDVSDVFTNSESNYYLVQQSPAIDAGDNQRIPFTLDIKDDPRIACANIVDQGAFEFTFSDLATSVMATEVPTDNCQGYYIQLSATAGAQHYHWLHTNEDTNVVQVSPLIPTEYTVITSNGGECLDTGSVYVIPSSMMSDTLGSPASVGTTFWLSYLRNHFHTPTLTLQVSADEACTGTVSNPQTGWSSSFSVAAHSVTVVNVPVSAAYPTSSDQVGNFGLLVQTTDSVSLYAANYNSSSFDVTNVLPVNALSDEYVLQTYTPMMNAEFVVVATVDNTVVDITPSRALQGGHAAQQTFSVTLQAGQTYLGMSQYGGILGDLSGTVIQSHDNKPVAVFNGNVCALVPSDNSYTDHLVEQAVGVNYWGRSFALTSTESQNFDVVRVTAQRNNTQIKKNGVLIATLQAYQTHEFQLNGAEGSCFIETSEPAGVYLYIAGAVQGNAEERSDPSMIWIPPTEQKLNDLTFATFNSPGITDHYVNIVIPASSINEVTLDGVSIGSQFALLAGNENFAFVRKHIANGTHTLHCDGGFIAHCYGLGYHESYGYAAGSKAVPLKEQLFVNGILNTDLPADMKFCPYEPITFAVELNYPCDSVVWNLGDGSPTVNGYSTVHDYADPGTYSVSATLYINSNGTVFCSNLYARVRVVPGPMLTFYDTVCQGDNYTSNGFDVEASESGHFTYTRAVSVPGQYCDSTFVLELEVRDNHLMMEDTICLGNSYQAYGFNFTPIETGLYTDTANAGMAADGCDSLVILQLMVTPNTDTPPEIEGELYPCQGGSYTYRVDSLSGLQQVQWTVADSIIVLQQQNPYEITLLFDAYADSFAICVSATGGCGVMNWCKWIYPQAYNFVQLTDTICVNETEYTGYGFTLTNISDSNDLFVNHSTAVGGCDSTTVLRLVIMPTYEVMDTIFVCENDFPYLYHDTLLPVAGDYVILLPTVFGCDSTVNLTLKSRPIHHTTFDTTVCDQMEWFGATYLLSGGYDTMLTDIYGCDSLVTMLLTVHYSGMAMLDSTICRDELPILWNGVTFTDADEQSAHLQTLFGCDSLVVMRLHVNELTEDTTTLTILQNDLPYEFNGYFYDSAGIYIQHLTNAAGCDSVLTVVLNVLNNVENTADSTICESELPFEWNGVTFEAAGAKLVILTAYTGADSVLLMNVTVNEVAYKDVYEIACDSMTWIDGVTYYESCDTNRYVLTAANGCDSVVSLHLTVNHSTTYVDVQSACDSLRWIDGNLYTESTNEPIFTLTNAAGCDSLVILHLTITNTDYTDYTEEVCDSLRWIDGNLYTESTSEPTFTLTNVGGCDSVVRLNLTVRYSSSGVDVYDVCDSLRWIDGNLYTESTDTPTFTLTNAAGCDSVVTLNLTVRHSTTYVDVYDVCDSLRWIDGNLYTESTNEPIFILTNASGCDSIVTLNLIVRHSTIYVDVQHACDSMRWIDGNLYTESTNEPTLLLTNAAGCDSLVTLHLTITNTDYTDYTDEVCDSLRWIDGNLYTESTSEPTFTLTNVGGCDSVVRLNLTVRYSTSGVDIYDVCDSLRWIDGNLYTESTNTPTFTLTNAAGCDSVVTLHLTVRHSTGTTINAEVVQNNLPYVLNDSTYTATGTYYQHFTNAVGCDSTVTLNLTVYNNTTAQVYATVCANALPYTWGGHVFATAGTFTDTLLTTHGADSVVTYTLTVDEIAATVPTVTHVTCFGGSNGAATATVTGGMPNFAYAWTNAEGVSVSTSTSISNQPAGIYTFTVTDVIGCVATATVTLNTLNEALQPGMIAEDQVVCEGEQPLPFTGTAATGGDNSVYRWEISTNNGMNWPAAPGTNNTQNYTYPDVPTSDFMLRRAWVGEHCGTVYSNTVSITLWPNTMDTVTAAVCQNEPYEGFGFEVTADQTAAPGDYTFEQHHATGHCDSVVVLILTVNPLFETEVEDVVCEGDGYDDNGFSINPMETVGEQQLTRTQTLQSVAGCDSVVTLQLRVIDTAVRIVSLTPDFCEDLSAELMVVTDMPNYVWSTGETAPSITVTHSGSYYVTASQGECSNTARFVIENCDDQLLLPNAITPSNHDGLNDYFGIPERNLRSINLFEIWIYNRWGELVYYSNDKNFHWNGEYRGEIQYQTIYNYVIRYTDAAGKPYFVKGSVTVL